MILTLVCGNLSGFIICITFTLENYEYWRCTCLFLPVVME